MSVLLSLSLLAPASGDLLRGRESDESLSTAGLGGSAVGFDGPGRFSGLTHAFGADVDEEDEATLAPFEPSRSISAGYWGRVERKEVFRL